MKLRHFFCITAIGIHMISGSKPPMSSGVIALNSFVLPVHEVDVSQAPTRGLGPYGEIHPDYPAHFVKVPIYHQVRKFQFYTSCLHRLITLYVVRGRLSRVGEAERSFP